MAARSIGTATSKSSSIKVDENLNFLKKVEHFFLEKINNQTLRHVKIFFH